MKTNILHFVGFRGDEYYRATRIFGWPDMIHYHWDKRAISDVSPGDTVVFANKEREDRVHEFARDDSAFF